MSRTEHIQESLEADVQHCHTLLWSSHSTFHFLYQKIIEFVKMMACVVWLSLLDAIRRRACMTDSISIVKLDFLCCIFFTNVGLTLLTMKPPLCLVFGGRAISVQCQLPRFAVFLNEKFESWIRLACWPFDNAFYKFLSGGCHRRAEIGFIWILWAYAWVLGCAQVPIDWMVTGIKSRSRCLLQLAHVVKETNPRSIFSRDDPSTTRRDKMCVRTTLPWLPSSTAADKSWRKRPESSPELNWLCNSVGQEEEFCQQAHLQYSVEVAFTCKTIASGLFVGIRPKIDKRCWLFLERKKFDVKVHNFFIFFFFFFPGSRCMPDAKAGRGFGFEENTIWGHLQQFESIGICVMILVQGSEMRIPFGSGSW